MTQTDNLVEELLSEFPTWIERTEIGEPTLQGRSIELISFKEKEKGQKTQAVLFDGAHHPRELVTIKMTLSILLKLLHGVHHKNQETLDLL